MRPRRTGTRALERLLGTGFSGFPVVRLDRESLPRRAGASFQTAAPRVIIGTERAFAFLPASTCGVSVILDGDALLSSLLPDAAEAALRTISRIAQLTEQPHERTVLVQTTMPTFPLFSALERGHVAAWVTKELADRERLNFPPYATLALCSRVFPSRSRARQETLKVVSAAKRSPRVRVGWRQSERGEKHRSDILLRGPRQELYRIITAQARAWDTDFHVPVSAALPA
jgi:primosomal protein N' (replication factor Y)